MEIDGFKGSKEIEWLDLLFANLVYSHLFKFNRKGRNSTCNEWIQIFIYKSIFKDLFKNKRERELGKDIEIGLLQGPLFLELIVR